MYLRNWGFWKTVWKTFFAWPFHILWSQKQKAVLLFPEHKQPERELQQEQESFRSSSYSFSKIQVVMKRGL